MCSNPLGLGTSPTVLSVLATRGVDDMARSLGKHGSLLAAATLMSTSVGATGAGVGPDGSVFSVLKAAGGRGAAGPDAVAASMQRMSLDGGAPPPVGSDPALFAKVSDLPTTAAPAEGGLASMIKRSGGAPGGSGSAIGGALSGGIGVPSSSGLSGSLGASPGFLGGHVVGGPVVLAASFRDPAFMPLSDTINEEEGASEEDSDVEIGGSGVKRGAGGLRPRPAPAGSLDDSDDEHPGPLASGGVALGAASHAGSSSSGSGSGGLPRGSGGSAASGKPPHHDDGGIFGDF